MVVPTEAVMERAAMEVVVAAEVARDVAAAALWEAAAMDEETVSAAEEVAIAEAAEAMVVCGEEETVAVARCTRCNHRI